MVARMRAWELMAASLILHLWLNLLQPQWVSLKVVFLLRVNSPLNNRSKAVLLLKVSNHNSVRYSNLSKVAIPSLKANLRRDRLSSQRKVDLLLNKQRLSKVVMLNLKVIQLRSLKPRLSLRITLTVLMTIFRSRVLYFKKHSFEFLK
jgi:hypothetical protein